MRHSHFTAIIFICDTMQIEIFHPLNLFASENGDVDCDDTLRE